MKTEVEKALETIKGSLCTGEAKGRNIVVLHRGWIFVGDLTVTDDGGYILTNASNVRKWSSGGFGGLTKSLVESNATLDPCQPIKFKDDALLFYSPVSED